MPSNPRGNQIYAQSAGRASGGGGPVAMGAADTANRWAGSDQYSGVASQAQAGTGPYGGPAGYNVWLDKQIQAQRDAGRKGTAVQGFQYNDYSKSEQDQAKRDYTTYTNQTNASNTINKAFDSFGAKGGYYDQVYQNSLNPAMAQINRAYTDAGRHQSFNAADRGLIGGSQDVFQKSRLGDAATMATQQAELGAQGQRDQVQTGYENERNQLLQSLYNPTNAGQSSNQAYQQSLQGLVSGQGGLNQSAMSQLGIQNNAQVQSSQNMGNLFNTAAGVVNASPYINGPQQSGGGMSSAFHGWTSGQGSTYQPAGGGGGQNGPSVNNGWGAV